MTFVMSPGRCPNAACAAEVREVKETYTAGPLAGTGRRVGRLTSIGTQLRFQLSDGTITEMAFCVECAAALRPADYDALWRAQMRYEDLAQRQHGASDAARLTRLAKLDAVFLLGKLAAIVDVPEVRGSRIDRRVQI